MSILIRLNKYIANAGIASRRHADDLISSGQVKLNGKTMSQLGTKIDPSVDQVEVAGQPISTPSQLVYYLINKPKGIISTTTDPDGKPTITSLVPTKDRVYPVGRLDVESEGLMLLTNDGNLAYHLTHPKFHHPKIYHVLINGYPSAKTLNLLTRGTKLKSGRNQPDSLSILSHQDGDTWLAITLHQGHKHQVRRLITGVNHRVLRLVRVQLGPFTLDDLGGHRYLQLEPSQVAAKLAS